MEVRAMAIEHHYEKRQHEYEVGEAIHNLNGRDYRVLEKYTDTTLLLLAQRTGEFVVGIGCGEYSKTPKDAPEKVEIGTEWDYGVYLGNNPNNIDFKALRKEFCPLCDKTVEAPEHKR
jgi:hypothetical protein